MKIAIRYFSRTGNTKKLAQVISEITSVPAQTVDVPLIGEVDILFLGSSIYAVGVAESVKEFIHLLDSSKVKNVVNFSTSAILPSTYSQVSKLLADKHIHMDSREFHCRGKFVMAHKDRPNDKDIADLKKFVNGILAEV